MECVIRLACVWPQLFYLIPLLIMILEKEAKKEGPICYHQQSIILIACVQILWALFRLHLQQSADFLRM